MGGVTQGVLAVVATILVLWFGGSLVVWVGIPLRRWHRLRTYRSEVIRQQEDYEKAVARIIRVREAQGIRPVAHLIDE